MAFNHDGALSAPGMAKNTYFEGVGAWAYGNNTSSASGNESTMEADLNKLAESFGVDSGYVSDDNKSDQANTGHPFTGHAFKPRLPSDTYPSKDALTSTKAHRGSSHHSPESKSTTPLARGTSSHKQQKRAGQSKTLPSSFDEDYSKSPHKFSSVDTMDSDSHLLDAWTETEERHERIAYRLERPADPKASKRNRTSGGK